MKSDNLTSKTKFHGLWLEANESQRNETFSVSCNRDVTIIYGNILSDTNGHPFIVKDDMPEQGSGEIYTIDPEVCESLTSQAMEALNEIDGDEDDEDEETTQIDDTTDESNEQSSDNIRMRSRQILRKGVKFQSYREFAHGTKK